MSGVQAIQRSLSIYLEGLAVCLFVLSTKENKFAQTFQEGKNLGMFTKGGNNKFLTIINQGEIKLEFIYDMNKSWGSQISRCLLNKRPYLSFVR